MTTLSVLYVDDEPDLLQIGKIFLESMGVFSIDTAGSATEGLPRITAKRYDAVISDYQMPGMDGLDFLRSVRSSGNDIPFILFTGRGREEIVITALNEGADFYLQKGGDPSAQFVELAHKIRIAVQRRQAALALEESERRYRDVVETQTEFISRFLPDGTHVFANDAYCRYFGKAREEMIGHRFIPPVPPEDRERVRGHMRSLTPDHPSAEIEHRIVLPDGSVRWQWWSDNAIFDKDGRVVEYQSVGKDITDRKVAEGALRASEQRFRKLVELSPIPIAQVKLDGTIVYLNPQFVRTTGFTLADIPTMEEWGRLAYRDQEYMQEIRKAWRARIGSALVKDKKIEPIVCRIQRKDGDARVIEFSGVVFGDYLLAIGRDMTGSVNSSGGDAARG